MKKTLLFAALLIGGLSQLSAQCTITPGCATGTTGYCTTPAANSMLPNATELMAYNTTIQVSIGSSLFGAAPITSATLTTITGMPAGMSYSINPPSGILPANSDACVLITGTPTMPGTYTITANVLLTAQGFGDVPGSAAWFLTVDPAGTVGIKSINTLASFFISPNPATSELFVSSASHFSKVQIIDALGKTVITHDANYSAQTTINVSALAKGVYFLQINDGTNLTTKKFIKD